METTITWPLALVTLLIVVVLAVWLRVRAKRAKDNHEHSAMTAGKPAQRRTDGAPGVDPQ